MSQQLLLLLRISKSEYNKTLYEDYRLYMNSQLSYRNAELTKGQYDILEGAIHRNPLIYKDNHAYIYCMYGIIYNPEQYDKKTNTYYHIIPWKYIKDFWNDDNTELMIVKNTSVFIQKFVDVVKKKKLYAAHGKVYYDLEEKINDNSYTIEAMHDKFSSIFHKVKNEYELQNEIRFAVIQEDKPEHYELSLEKSNDLRFATAPLEYGKNILVKLTNLEFDNEHTVPKRFSSEIILYEGEAIND